MSVAPVKAVDASRVVYALPPFTHLAGPNRSPRKSVDLKIRSKFKSGDWAHTELPKNNRATNTSKCLIIEIRELKKKPETEGLLALHYCIKFYEIQPLARAFRANNTSNTAIPITTNGIITP